MAKLQAQNAVVFGISADTVESHKGFVEKEHLNFPLLADPEKKVIAAYGALMPNGQMANRYTFVIGPDGRIVSIDRNVNGQFDRGDGKLTSRHGDNLALLLSDWKAKVGQPVPPFAIGDVEGRSATLLPAGKKAAVVVFVSTTCPVSNAYEGRLAALAADPAYKDVAFLALDANANESAAAVKSHYAGKLPFPVAKDAKSALADHFGANNTPTVWVVNAKGVAVYSGAVDDSQNAAGVKQAYLKDALDATLAGQPVATSQTRAVGCAIRRR